MIQPVIRITEVYVYKMTGSGVRYLLLKRSSESLYGGLWQGVAGKIDSCETAWQAAIREVEEETGLVPLAMYVVEHVSGFYELFGDRVNLVPYFGAEVDSLDVTLSHEHEAYQWLTLEEALEYLTWEAQKSAVKALDNMLQTGGDKLKWSQIDLSSIRRK
jgi:dATP pyrophosphohydrolase